MIKINTDPFYILDKFLNEQLKVDDYYNYKEASDTYFSSLLGNNSFSKLSSEKQTELYSQVLKLKSSYLL